MSKSQKQEVPKWLTELQHRSWEPEILLSGIVLYGMFKVPELLDEGLQFFKLNIFGDSNDVDNLVALFKMGIYWLISGLILHLICRGIWIGMVGLSYTFPDGIRLDKLTYKGKFAEKAARTPSFENIVIRLEKISSSLFSISFMLFMTLIGGYFFFLVLVIVPFTVLYLYFDLGWSGVLFDTFQVYVTVILVIAVLALVDFVTLGYFRRFRFFVKIYWPLHRVISLLTLSRFYRPIYYGVVSNFNKWVFFIFLVVFSFVSILGAGSITNTDFPGDPYSQLSLWSSPRGYATFSGYYSDQNKDKPSYAAHIPSDVISGNVLKVFLVARITFEEEIEEHTPLDSLQKVYPDTTVAALKLMMVKEFYELYINDERVSVEKIYYHYNAETNQRGYLTYLPIGHLPEGVYELTIKGPQPEFKTPTAVIPFYRDVPQATRSIIQQPEEEEGADFQPKPFGVR